MKKYQQDDLRRLVSKKVLEIIPQNDSDGFDLIFEDELVLSIYKIDHNDISYMGWFLHDYNEEIE